MITDIENEEQDDDERDANKGLHLTAWGRGGSPVATVKFRGRAPMRQVKPGR